MHKNGYVSPRFGGRNKKLIKVCGKAMEKLLIGGAKVLGLNTSPTDFVFCETGLSSSPKVVRFLYPVDIRVVINNLSICFYSLLHGFSSGLLIIQFK